MRRITLVFLALFVCSIPRSFAEEMPVDLTVLTTAELNEFIKDINDEIELHHTTNSATNQAVLAATKDVVEA